MNLEVLTVEEAAARLKVERRTVVRLCAAGRLRGARKVGRCWRVPESAILALFAEPIVDADLPREAQGNAPRDGVERPSAARGDRRGQQGRGARARGADAPSTRGRPIPDAAADGPGFLRLLDGGVRTPRARAPRS